MQEVNLFSDTVATNQQAVSGGNAMATPVEKLHLFDTENMSTGTPEAEDDQISLFGILAKKKLDTVTPTSATSKPKPEIDKPKTLEELQVDIEQYVQTRMQQSLSQMNVVDAKVSNEKQKAYQQQLELDNARTEQINLFSNKAAQVPAASGVKTEQMTISSNQSVDVAQPNTQVQSCTMEKEALVRKKAGFADKLLSPAADVADLAISKMQNSALVSHFEELPKGVVREFEIALDTVNHEAMIMQCVSETPHLVMPSKVNGCIVKYVKPSLFTLNAGKLAAMKNSLIFGVKRQYSTEVRSLVLPQCLQKLPNGFLHEDCILDQLIIPATCVAIESNAFTKATINKLVFAGRPPKNIQEIRFPDETTIFCKQQFAEFFEGIPHVHVLGGGD